MAEYGSGGRNCVFSPKRSKSRSCEGEREEVVRIMNGFKHVYDRFDRIIKQICSHLLLIFSSNRI